MNMLLCGTLVFLAERERLKLLPIVILILLGGFLIEWVGEFCVALEEEGFGAVVFGGDAKGAGDFWWRADLSEQGVAVLGFAQIFVVLGKGISTGVIRWSAGR